MKKNTLFISKGQAFQICDKSQYGESTLWEKIKLNFRYLWCRATRAYVHKNRKLTQSIESSKLDCLEYSEQKLLEERFQEQLKNQV